MYEDCEQPDLVVRVQREIAARMRELDRTIDVYAKLVAEWNQWNASMLPEVDESYTFSFSGADLADHVGAKPASGKADNPGTPTDSQKSR